MKLIILLASFGTVALAQKEYTTPVPILKQINRHNEDGSYSYGYEAADGAFKIETKYPNGEVHGKYGYIDNEGVKREVEYGASKRGFEPAGSDINVPPPTLNNNANSIPLGPDEEDDGQYREDPSIYWKDPKYNQGVKHSTKSRPIAPVTYTQPQYTQPQYTAPAPKARKPAFQQPIYEPEEPAYREPVYQPPQPQYNNYQPYYQRRSEPVYSHPAIENFDINSGSYTINYGR